MIRLSVCIIEKDPTEAICPLSASNQRIHYVKLYLWLSEHNHEVKVESYMAYLCNVTIFPFVISKCLGEDTFESMKGSCFSDFCS